ncbi:hypothetical protein [Streptomyces sp. NPDC048340]|uniref:hypothetical protein n=1 Tax=Streptomyces sp. NPDC048340 TaxID=3365537 RepID=UPI00371A110B
MGFDKNEAKATVEGALPWLAPTGKLTLLRDLDAVTAGLTLDNADGPGLVHLPCNRTASSRSATAPQDLCQNLRLAHKARQACFGLR